MYLILWKKKYGMVFHVMDYFHIGKQMFIKWSILLWQMLESHFSVSQ